MGFPSRRQQLTSGRRLRAFAAVCRLSHGSQRGRVRLDVWRFTDPYKPCLRLPCFLRLSGTFCSFSVHRSALRGRLANCGGVGLRRTFQNSPPSEIPPALNESSNSHPGLKGGSKVWRGIMGQIPMGAWPKGRGLMLCSKTRLAGSTTEHCNKLSH